MIYLTVLPIATSEIHPGSENERRRAAKQATPSVSRTITVRAMLHIVFSWQPINQYAGLLGILHRTILYAWQREFVFEEAMICSSTTWRYLTYVKNT